MFYFTKEEAEAINHYKKMQKENDELIARIDKESYFSGTYQDVGMALKWSS